MTKKKRIYAIAFSNINGERFVTFFRFDPDNPGPDWSRAYKRCREASLSRFNRALMDGDTIYKSNGTMSRTVRRIDERAYHH